MDTLLLIEDDSDLLNSTSRILSLSNYKVITAENGRIALEQMKENAGRLSLILCDINMPELDGYGVFHAYKNSAELEGIPFIFMTSNFERTDVRKGMDLGADDYLTKPFTGNEILSLISARIKKSQESKEKRNASALELGNILFEKTDFDSNENFKNNFHVKRILKKDILFIEGETSRYIYYVIKGKVKQFKTTELGKEYITNIYKSGDFFGHNALYESSKHLDSAIALEDSEIGILPKDEFLKVLFNNKEMCAKYIRYISTLLNKAEEKLPKLAYYSARKRVAEALLYVAKSYREKDSENICFSVSRDDLSAISGIAAESVSRNLTDFKSEGLIENRNGKLTILDFKKLETLKN